MSFNVTGLIAEFRRRKVLRTAAGYLAAAFVLLQVAELIFEPLGFSAQAYRAVVVVCALGFPVAVALSWLFDLRAERSTSGEPVRGASGVMAIVLIAATGIAGFTVVRWRAADPVVVREIRSSETPDALITRLDEQGYDDYVRAKFFLARTNPQTLDSATMLLERVVERYPTFPQARAQLALAYMYQFSLYRAVDPEYERKAFVESEKALALDPRNAEAHIVRGRILWTPSGGFVHEQAAGEYRRVLQLDPNNSEAYFQLGQVYTHVGLTDEALEQLENATRLSPTDPRARGSKAMALFSRGEAAEALALFRTLPETYNPTLFGSYSAIALSRLGRGDEALEHVRRYLANYDDDAGLLTSAHALLVAKSGQPADAQLMINKAAGGRRASIHFHHTAYNIGLTYVRLAEPDSAIKWLQIAADEGFPCYPLFASDPDLAKIRGDVRFQRLLQDLRARQQRYRKLAAAPLAE